MLRWLAEGTQFLHQYGVAHNDLKPENVMGGVSRDGNSDYLKLIDFGTHSTSLFPVRPILSSPTRYRQILPKCRRQSRQ